jgi:hypothetical protein
MSPKTIVNVERRLIAFNEFSTTIVLEPGHASSANIRVLVEENFRVRKYVSPADPMSGSARDGCSMSGA